jgi:hypothetical protein
MDNVFYFHAQTGVWLLRKFKAPSNHTYTLDWKYLGKVQSAVRDAEVSPAGLKYPADFLWWLEHNDLEKSV